MVGVGGGRVVQPLCPCGIGRAGKAQCLRAGLAPDLPTRGMAALLTFWDSVSDCIVHDVVSLVWS